MAASTADLNTLTKRVTKDGRMARRSMGFWCQFNCWYRTFWEAEGRRPSVTEVKRWYDEAADGCWGHMKPTWDETRTHSKCLRSLDQVRSYFRQYRAAKKESSDGCRGDVALKSSTVGSAEVLHPPFLNSAGLPTDSHQDDVGADVAFFRAAKVRRPSADGGYANEGGQYSGYNSGDLSFSETASPGAQERAAQAPKPRTSGLAAYGAAVAAAAGANATSVAAGQHCGSGSGSGASSRTISTGAAGRDFPHASSTGLGANPNPIPARLVCSDDAFARRPASHAPGGNLTTLSAAVAGAAAAAWPGQSPVSRSQQLAKGNPRRPQQPNASWSLPVTQPQGHCYSVAAALHLSSGPGNVAPPLLSGVLRPGLADAASSSPLPPADRPPRPRPPPKLATQPSEVATPSPPGPLCRRPGAGVSGCAGGARGGGAPALAAAAAAPGGLQQPQQHTNARGQAAPAQSLEAATAWGQPQPQPQSSFAAQVTTASVLPMGTSAYAHHHRHPAHPMMHMGYDTVYGHASYMDPYAYSYGTHDPGASYWRMYPSYCYPSAQHPSHVLYSELPPHVHMPDYRDATGYGAMVMPAGAPLCVQQGAAGTAPAAQFPLQADARAAVAAAHGCASGMSKRSSDPGAATRHKMAGSRHLLPSQQPGPAAHPSRPASFSDAPLSDACIGGDVPWSAPHSDVWGSGHQLPTTRSTDLGRDLTPFNVGGVGAAAAQHGSAPGKPSGAEAAQQQRLPQASAAAAAKRGPTAPPSSGSEPLGAGAGGAPSAAAEAEACPMRQGRAMPVADVCDITAVLRVQPGLVSVKLGGELGLKPPFALCGRAGFSRDLGVAGSGFGFDASPGLGTSPQNASQQQPQQQRQGVALQRQLKQSASDTPGPPWDQRGPNADTLAPGEGAAPGGVPTLDASGLDLLPLPDLLALGSDLDIDCSLFLNSPPAATMAAAGSVDGF